MRLKTDYTQITCSGLAARKAYITQQLTRLTTAMIQKSLFENMHMNWRTERVLPFPYRKDRTGQLERRIRWLLTCFPHIIHDYCSFDCSRSALRTLKDREQRDAGEESEEDGQLMWRLDAGRADGMTGSDGWGVEARRLLVAAASPSADWAQCCTQSSSCFTLTLCGCTLMFTRQTQ